MSTFTPASVEYLAIPLPLDKQRLNALGLFGLNVGCGTKFPRDYGNPSYLYCDSDRLVTSGGVASRPDTLCQVDSTYLYIEYRAPKRLPIEAQSIHGLFCEHMLEHLDPRSILALLREFRRVLAPGGVLRISVPDLEKYLRAYVDSANDFFGTHADRILPILIDPSSNLRALFDPDMDDSPEHLRQLPELAKAATMRNAFMINQSFYCWGHRWAFDFEELRYWLMRAGFESAQITRASYREGKDRSLAHMDLAFRADESLYVEVHI